MLGAMTTNCNVSSFCFEDELSLLVQIGATKPFTTFLGLFYTVKVLANAGIKDEAVRSIFSILDHLGETSLQPMGADLMMNIQEMNSTIRSRTDESLLNMDEINQEREIFLLRIYGLLVHLIHFLKPTLLPAACLRMIQLSLSGFCFMTPVAFAHFGEVLASIGDLDLSCRLGTSQMHSRRC